MLRKVSSLVVIALSMILIGSAWAADTLWSVDIQGAGSSGFGQLDPPTLMEGVEPTYGFGNVWNAFNVAGHDLPALVDPSMQLVDSEGNATVVTFSITGNISGFSYNNTIPLVQDYLFVNAGNSDVSVSWSISGLKAGSTYELYTYGGGVVGRDGGHTAEVADACVVIPTVNPTHITPHTEAFQGVVWHLLVSHPRLKQAETKWESVR